MFNVLSFVPAVFFGIEVSTWVYQITVHFAYVPNVLLLPYVSEYATINYAHDYKY